ncbi:hypothetical protein [Sphingomonas glacialis]|nr:hypothetical protein [Sphingomonas glacialis]
MRYSAPIDTTSIDLTTGPVAVVGGFIEVDDHLSLGDAAGLIANGFLPASLAETQPAPVAKTVEHPAGEEPAA